MTASVSSVYFIMYNTGKVVGTKQRDVADLYEWAKMMKCLELPRVGMEKKSNDGDWSTWQK